MPAASSRSHPRLRAATDAGLAEYVRRHPERPRPTRISVWRPQLDCSRVAGACSSRSLHSIPGGVSRAEDIDSPTWTKTSDPRGHAADLARYIRAADPCVRWGGTFAPPNRDYPHFELPFACDGQAGIETALGTAARGVPHAVAQAVDGLAARMGVPAWSLYLGGGVAIASLLASVSNRD